MPLFDLLKQYNITACKKYGQNFLIDDNIIKKILLSTHTKATNILEIGAGPGTLSRFLLQKKCPLWIVEIDKQFIPLLQEAIKPHKQATFLNQDILTVHLSDLSQDPFTVIGNLPYNISSQIITQWLTPQRHRIETALFMLQKEMAERLSASVHTKSYGRLSILTQTYFTVEKKFNVPASCFSPRPKVASQVVGLIPRSNTHNIDPSDLELITHCFFRERRKTIRKPLERLFQNQAQKVIEKMDLTPTHRPENLAPEIYVQLAELYCNFIKEKHGDFQPYHK